MMTNAQRQKKFRDRRKVEMARLRAIEAAWLRQRKSTAQTNPRKIGGVQRDGPTP
jgi:hypothetical protein